MWECCSKGQSLQQKTHASWISSVIIISRRSWSMLTLPHEITRNNWRPTVLQITRPCAMKVQIGNNLNYHKCSFDPSYPRRVTPNKVTGWLVETVVFKCNCNDWETHFFKKNKWLKILAIKKWVQIISKGVMHSVSKNWFYIYLR